MSDNRDEFLPWEEIDEEIKTYLEELTKPIVEQQGWFNMEKAKKLGRAAEKGFFDSPEEPYFPRYRGH